MNRFGQWMSRNHSAITFIQSPSSRINIPGSSTKEASPRNVSVMGQDERLAIPAMDPYKGRIILPSLVKGLKYSLPDFTRLTLLAPAYDKEILDQTEPATDQVYEAPPLLPAVPVLAAPRMLTIRRKKMKKHKRRKRYNRDWAKYQKYHREKKLKAEREYQKRMKAHLAELEAFQPEKYVEEVIEGSNKVWQNDLAPTGRKLYPHWSRLMALEELYGLPKSDYIDKRSGFPSEDYAAKIEKKKKEYENTFKNLPVLTKTRK